VKIILLEFQGIGDILDRIGNLLYKEVMIEILV
jgi:hypothetical protein